MGKSIIDEFSLAQNGDEGMKYKNQELQVSLEKHEDNLKSIIENLTFIRTKYSKTQLALEKLEGGKKRKDDVI